MVGAAVRDLVVLEGHVVEDLAVVEEQVMVGLVVAVDVVRAGEILELEEGWAATAEKAAEEGVAEPAVVVRVVGSPAGEHSNVRCCSIERLLHSR
jgi:hypothetical protein